MVVTEGYISLGCDTL